MIKNYSATEAKNNFGLIIQDIEEGHKVYVSRYEKRILEIIPVKRSTKKRDINELFGAIPDFPDVTKDRKLTKDISL